MRMCFSPRPLQQVQRLLLEYELQMWGRVATPISPSLDTCIDTCKSVIFPFPLFPVILYKACSQPLGSKWFTWIPTELEEKSASPRDMYGDSQDVVSLFWGRGTEEAFDVQEMVPSCLEEAWSCCSCLAPLSFGFVLLETLFPSTRHRHLSRATLQSRETSSGYISVLMFMYHIYPQQHGHFQWPDFEDNSSFFISGVFSSVLILDTFFF